MTPEKNALDALEVIMNYCHTISIVPDYVLKAKREIRAALQGASAQRLDALAATPSAQVPADRAEALDAFDKIKREITRRYTRISLDEHSSPALREDLVNLGTIEAYLTQPAPVEKVEGLAEAIKNMYATFDWHGSLNDRAKVLEAARLQLARQEGK